MQKGQMKIQRGHLEDRKLSLILFVFIWTMYMVVYMTKNCYSAAMASIVHEGIMTKSQTGFILAVFYLVYAPLQVVGGRLADRGNPEKLITLGLMGSAVANFIIYFNQNYYVMLATWTFNAVVQASIYPAVFKIVSSQLKHSHRKKGTFFISLSSSVGLFMAYAVAMLFTKWQYNFLISAILLFGFAVALYIIYPHIEKHMVPDETPLEEKREAIKRKGMESGASLGNVFLESGFYWLVPGYVFYFLAGNMVKTLSPTLLMESYENISPAMGNFLNLFIIVAGVAGTFAVRYLLYPRFMKEELKGILFLLMVMLPFTVLLLFVGSLPAFLMVVAMAFVGMLSSAMGLLLSFFIMRFTKFGKEGEAAGIANAGASIGIVIQSYGITYLADAFGWQLVIWVILALVVIAGVMIAALIPRWLKFAKKHQV